MSIWSAVCDYWVTDLQTNVTGLDTSTVPATRVHRYAPWSPEELFTEAVGERHLAIWPELDAESTEPLTVTGDRISEQTYAIIVWENASDTQGRGQDDDTANAAWLTLAEGIRTRLMTTAGFDSGSASVMSTDYIGTSFQRSGTHRVMAVGFRCRVPLTRA